MTAEQDPGTDAPMLRGHVRIWISGKGERQWSVTCPVGVPLEDLEAARANAQAIADKLAESPPRH